MSTLSAHVRRWNAPAAVPPLVHDEERPVPLAREAGNLGHVREVRRETNLAVEHVRDGARAHLWIGRMVGDVKRTVLRRCPVSCVPVRALMQLPAFGVVLCGRQREGAIFAVVDAVTARK